jgi:Cd2+/Zn2+-exporting ATPase
LGFVSLIVAVLVGDMGASLAVTANALRLARVSPAEAEQ